MQYGQALERLIREVVIANPALEPMHVLKADFSGSFYHIVLHLTDAPTLGIVFPLEGEDEEFVVIPVTLPMVWRKLLPIF